MIDPVIDQIISLILIWCCLTILVEDRKERIKYFTIVVFFLILIIIDTLFFESFFVQTFIVAPLMWLGNSMMYLMDWLFDFIEFNIWWLIPMLIISIWIILSMLPDIEESSNAQKETEE